MATFEDWLMSQTTADRPRGIIAQLMLDQRLHEVDFGSSAVRDEFRRMLADFEADTRGLLVRSTPLPFRARRPGRRPVLDLQDDVGPSA
ncbi:hypothetical protein ACVGVM_20065 [Pseudonocardia bannensis]|uniref:Uncharacterized protein n=1 Tax=Pseudonocardia bannensis TaxID=630973 RepID=A0A848DFB5_9PSEU|nr:hypothetical protein [Pseudonocardia bannensis]NMH91243.1 hypothetical protein [Pseudonocardia bannensis]